MVKANLHIDKLNQGFAQKKPCAKIFKNLFMRSVLIAAVTQTDIYARRPQVI